MSKVTAVIPAAGNGTRLGSSVPKVFTEIVPFVSPWTILKAALAPLVDHIELVLAPPVAKLYGDALKGIDGGVGISEQAEPRGMGDAVFCADWHDADTIVVVWGDQIGVNPDTVSWALDLCVDVEQVVIPLVRHPEPYVEYHFKDSRLHGISHAREGDLMATDGLSDVGVFVLSTMGLCEMWDDYMTYRATHELAGELNFLPFLVYLAKSGWDVMGIPLVGSVDEARGLNAPEDLEWARERFSK